MILRFEGHINGTVIREFAERPGFTLDLELPCVSVRWFVSLAANTELNKMLGDIFSDKMMASMVCDRHRYKYEEQDELE